MNTVDTGMMEADVSFSPEQREQIRNLDVLHMRPPGEVSPDGGVITQDEYEAQVRSATGRRLILDLRYWSEQAGHTDAEMGPVLLALNGPRLLYHLTGIVTQGVDIEDLIESPPEPEPSLLSPAERERLQNELDILQRVLETASYCGNTLTAELERRLEQSSGRS